MIKNIILDIDRTLVHSVEKNIVKKEWLEFFETVDIGDYIVFLRPGVREFINWLTESQYTVGLFTASCRGYATEISKILFKNDPLFILSEVQYDDARFKYKRLKPLEYVIDLYPTLILSESLLIDDSNSIKKHNEKYCYKIRPFVVCFDDSKGFCDKSIEDKELIKCKDFIKMN
jgi:hypothetical protein